MFNFLDRQVDGTGWQYDVATTTYFATTSAKATQVAETLFNGFLNLLTQLLPYGIGILIFFIGWNLARRALSGR